MRRTRVWVPVPIQQLTAINSSVKGSRVILCPQRAPSKHVITYLHVAQAVYNKIKKMCLFLKYLLIKQTFPTVTPIFKSLVTIFSLM